LPSQEHRASTLEQELSDLRAKKTDRGMVLTLGDVLFDTGMATLKPGAYTTIDRLATVLKEAPDRKVMIEGHTDSVGGDDYNQQLSQRRAAAVQTALLERGVTSNQITAVGKGETFPVASNDNAAGRQQNRRVEMVFTDDSSQVASDVN
jgi:outer membrane protein OmpA-like peptidoglycan-associated protein